MSDGFWGAFFGCLPLIAALYFKHLWDMRRLDQQTETLVNNTKKSKQELLDKTEETKKVVIAKTIETQEKVASEAAEAVIVAADKATDVANDTNKKMVELRRDFQVMMKVHEDNIAANARHTLANKTNVETLQMAIKVLTARLEQDKGKT